MEQRIVGTQCNKFKEFLNSVDQKRAENKQMIFILLFFLVFCLVNTKIDNFST